MKAVILAGGEGRRLRDISGGLPKPMMPLLGKPLLERIVALLRENGFDALCMTLRYEAEQIRSHFGDGGDFGVSIEYRVEEEALGTAGAVKNCIDFVDGEDFLVISGDCACDFELAELMRAHRGGVTIALSEQEEPLSYGLVLTGRAGRVTGFLEKPGWERVVTDTVSTGVYAVSPCAMEHVPAGRPFDFARDLFPLLLARGVPLHGCRLAGYWCDIGTPRAYYQCNLDALDGIYRLAGGSGARRSVVPCKSRARLMRAMSEAMAEFAADFSDGLRLESKEGRVHAAPLAEASAVSLEGEGPLYARLAALARRLAAEQ